MKYILIIIAITAIGCGSITHGTMQKIPVSSNPDNAVVLVDKKESGATPCVIELKRKVERYDIEIKKEGYVPVIIQLIRQKDTGVSGANFMIDFGLISHLIIDKSTGGAYELVPDSVHVELKEKE